MLLTQAQKAGGGSGKKTDDVLNEIAADVLAKVFNVLTCGHNYYV